MGMGVCDGGCYSWSQNWKREADVESLGDREQGQRG